MVVQTKPLRIVGEPSVAFEKEPDTWNLQNKLISVNIWIEQKHVADRETNEDERKENMP